MEDRSLYNYFFYIMTRFPNKPNNYKTPHHHHNHQNHQQGQGQQRPPYSQQNQQTNQQHNRSCKNSASTLNKLHIRAPLDAERRQQPLPPPQVDSSSSTKSTSNPHIPPFSEDCVEKANEANAATSKENTKSTIPLGDCASSSVKVDVAAPLILTNDRWIECHRQESSLVMNMNMLKLLITTHPTQSVGSDTISTTNIQHLRLQLFDNALSAMTIFNNVLSTAVETASPMVGIKTSSEAELKAICEQTQKWSSMLQFRDLNEKTGKEDRDLVIDDDIVILNGKTSSERDFLCPISLKPFKQPMRK